MSELVKISLAHLDNSQMIWPLYCPRCGATANLVRVEARVGVVHDDGHSLSVLSSILNMTTEATYLSFPVCKRHALSNQVGIRLLEKSSVPRFLRFLIYLAFFVFCFTAFQVFSGDNSILLKVKQNTSFAYFLLAGPVGLLTILWARSVSSVWPIDIDSSKNVVSIRFINEHYAQEFKRANPRATHRLATRTTLFFLRKDFWVFVILALIIYNLFKRLG